MQASQKPSREANRLRLDVHSLHVRRQSSVETSPAKSTVVVQDHAVLNMPLKSTNMFVNSDVWWPLRVLIITGCVRHDIMLSACRSTRPLTCWRIKASMRKKELTAAPIAQGIDNSIYPSPCLKRGLSDEGKHHVPYHHDDFERKSVESKNVRKSALCLRFLTNNVTHSGQTNTVGTT
jgi:hypothetical protein